MDGVMYGLSKTPPIDGRRAAGWRILLPIFPLRRTGYDIRRDEFRTRLWVFSVGLSVEPLVASDLVVGISLRLTWGWA